MSYEYNRNLRDAQKEVSVALAQAGANTPALDLEQTIGGDVDGIVCQLAVPAVPGIADTKTLTYQLQDSADGTNWTNVDPAITTSSTASGGLGTAVKDARFRLPPITRRYIRISQTATASAGTFSQSLTLRLLF